MKKSSPFQMSGLVLVFALSVSSAFAIPAGHPVSMINLAVDDTKLVKLSGNTRPEANTLNDRGAVSSNFSLDHMLLQLQRSPEQETALRSFIDDLHNADSANFHKWLTPDGFASQYGIAPEDVATVSAWLTSKGFTVNGSPASGMIIDFSGTAAQVTSAFHTDIHKLSVAGVSHFANMSDPQIPAALAPVVAGVISLHDFHPKAQLIKKNPLYTYTNSNGTRHVLVAGDIEAIYNINPLLVKGYSGTGQSIMVVEDTYLYSTGDWTVFRKTFGLERAYPNGSLSQVSPKGAIHCKNPGFQGAPTDPGYGDDGEAAIDVEWASAAAPNAAIILAACEDTTTTFGGLIALVNTLSGPADSLPSVVSISYGESEEYNGASANLAYHLAYQQAISEGVSIFVSSGDENAASSDFGNPATHGITVSGFTSSPYDVSVGGLDFGYRPELVPASKFWNASNSPTYESARGYIPEIPWNDSCAGGLLANYLGTTPLSLCNNSEVTDPKGPLNFLLNSIGGSGGPSGCAIGFPSKKGEVSGTCIGYDKPAYQKGLFGNPKDGVRDTPDVSLFASNGFWDSYYVVCWSNPDPNVGGGSLCTGAPSTWAGFGGTSISSPIMAGIQTLVNQKTGSRWGNPNTVYYSLAKTEYGSAGSSTCNSNATPLSGSPCIFHDITEGDNDSACTAKASGAHKDCYIPAGDVYGVLSTSKSVDQPAYLTNVGWDFATGIGSVDAYNLVMNWPTKTTP